MRIQKMIKQSEPPAETLESIKDPDLAMLLRRLEEVVSWSKDQENQEPPRPVRR